MDDSSVPIGASLSLIRTALLQGDYTSLARLTAALEQDLTQTLPGVSEASLRSLRRRAEENAVLLRAAQRGLRAAQRRIAEIRGVAGGLTTYSASGQRQTMATRGGPDHRA